MSHEEPNKRPTSAEVGHPVRHSVSKGQGAVVFRVEVLCHQCLLFQITECFGLHRNEVRLILLDGKVDFIADGAVDAGQTDPVVRAHLQRGGL